MPGRGNKGGSGRAGTASAPPFGAPFLAARRAVPAAEGRAARPAPPHGRARLRGAAAESAALGPEPLGQATKATAASGKGVKEGVRRPESSVTPVEAAGEEPG